MNRLWIAGVLAGAVALAGCSDDDEDPLQAFCSGFGNGATFDLNCVSNCSVLNEPLASDGNLQTTAGIVPNAATTTDTATMTATSVNNIAGGAVVGVWVTQPSTLSSTANDFETFLNGTPQEELDLDPQTGNGVVVGADEGTPAQGFIGMRTTLEFDEVRFTTTNTWPANAQPVYSVYEICSDGGNS